VTGNKAEIVLTEVAVSDTKDNGFIQVLSLSDDRTKVSVSDFKPGIPGRINNNPHVNIHPAGLRKDLFDYHAVPKDTFQSKIAHDFMKYLRFIPSIRETQKSSTAYYGLICIFLVMFGLLDYILATITHIK
jgi:hypothetical protein